MPNNTVEKRLSISNTKPLCDTVKNLNPLSAPSVSGIPVTLPGRIHFLLNCFSFNSQSLRAPRRPFHLSPGVCTVHLSHIFRFIKKCLCESRVKEEFAECCPRCQRRERDAADLLLIQKNKKITRLVSGSRPNPPRRFLKQESKTDTPFPALAGPFIKQLLLQSSGSECFLCFEAGLTVFTVPDK